MLRILPLSSLWWIPVAMSMQRTSTVRKYSFVSRVETVVTFLKAGADPRIVDNEGDDASSPSLSEIFDVAVRI